MDQKFLYRDPNVAQTQGHFFHTQQCCIIYCGKIKTLKLFSCWTQPVNASLPSKVKMTFINYPCLSPYPMLPQHKHKNSLAVDRIDLPGKCLPQKREDFQQGQFTAPLYFTAIVMLIPQIARVRCAVRNNLPQVGITEAQSV